MLQRGTFVWVLALVVVAACTNDFGKFNFGDPPDDNSGGAGGAGGMGGMGGAPECVEPSTCPGTDNDCQQRSCPDGTCGISFNLIGSPCNDNGGLFCDGVGSCVECNYPTDCTSGVCMNNQCQPGNCNDTTMNEDETDVDCGGSCPACADGLMCLLAGDCQSGFCDATNTCAACMDETDCGGVADSYCDNGSCVPKKADGVACAAADECLNGACPGDDGVCCDGACDQTCEACLMAKTGVADGSCAPVTAASDPDTECDGNSITCEGLNCGGTAGACEPAAAAVLCRASLGLCDTDEFCDGSNTGCPADVLVAANTECRGQAGLCDVAEVCDGAMPTCPADAFEVASSECRAVAGLCDVAEVCDGVSAACPADTFEAANTECRGVAGMCDLAEVCDGASAACPTDAFQVANTSCRGAAGSCDSEEVCDGLSAVCPPDVLIGDNQASTMDLCAPYLCDGALAVCPTSCVGDEDCAGALTCATNVCQ